MEGVDGIDLLRHIRSDAACKRPECQSCSGTSQRQVGQPFGSSVAYRGPEAALCCALHRCGGLVRQLQAKAQKKQGQVKGLTATLEHNNASTYFLVLSGNTQ